MPRPLLLDLFSGAGGAGVGYHRAGFDVIGVDVDRQPAYPFEHWRMDAFEVLDNLTHGKWVGLVGGRRVKLSDIDAFHASPPCQGYTALKAVHGNDWPLLIEPVRDVLDAIGKPYVIENVQGAPVRRDLVLCGEMFGLGVIRHRYFELGGWSMPQPAHVMHRGRVSGWRHGVFYPGPYVAVYGNGGGKAGVSEAREAMDIDWMDTLHDLVEAIPPAYTTHVGRGMLEVIHK